jgi:GLPGLI family protein
MNKIKSFLLLSFLIAANVVYVNAQKLSEGKAVFEISYPDSDIPDEQMAQMPTEMSILFKGDKSRIDMKMGMGMSTTIIKDGKAKEATTLFDMMGNKMAVKTSAEDMKKQKEKAGEDNQVKLTDETKDIAGYKCKKAVVTGSDGSFDVYYTDDIVDKSNFDEQFKGISGFLMEFQRKQGQINMKMTAKSVSKEKVDDKQFEIPSDYKLMTQDEMKKMFGGGQ